MDPSEVFDRPGFIARQTPINGQPGLIGYFGEGRPQGAVTFEVAAGSIGAIRLVVNPEKLRAVAPLPEERGRS